MIDEIVTVLNDWNWAAIIAGIFVGLAAAKGGIGLIAWFFDFLGIETKWMRKRKEQAELLQNTADAVKKLAEETKEIKKEHAKDKTDVVNQNLELKNMLTGFMDEMRQSISENHQEIQHFYDKQLEFKGESIDREQRLNNRINGMAEKDDSRDALIENIGKSLDHLTEMFIDKEINDYRWEIINFASNVAAGKPCTKDAYIHCFKTYEKYEKVLEENNLENGEVEISMEVVNESYKKKLVEGFDNE